MPGVTIGPNTGGTTLPAPDPIGIDYDLQRYTTEVWVRESWHADHNWVHVPYLEPLRATQRSLPGANRAEFKWRFGAFRQTGETAATTYARQFVRDHYIAIRIVPQFGAPYTVWSGIVPIDQAAIGGTRTSVAHGTQSIVALGWEYLLSRRAVDGARVIYDGGVGQPYDTKLIDWQPAFNERLPQGLGLFGNSSFDKAHTYSPTDVERTYVFGDGAPWSHRDIIEYLLFWSDPALGDASQQYEPAFVLGGDELLLNYLEYVNEVVPQDRHSVWDILKIVIDRRRGLSATFVTSAQGVGDPDDPSEAPGDLPGGSIELQLFSLTDTPVGTFPQQLPENAATASITLDTDIAQQTVIETVDSTTQYDEILVSGARALVAFTCATNTYRNTDHTNGNTHLMEKAWVDADEVAYKAASDDDRRRDELSAVYTTFKLPTDPTLRYQNGTAVVPGFFTDGEIFPGATGTSWKIDRILREFPISNPADVSAGAVDPRLLRTIAMVEMLDDGAPTGIYVKADNPPAKAGKDTPSASVTPLDRGGAIEVAYKQAQHLLGKNHITNAEAGPIKPQFDYDRMLITVCIETDSAPVILRTTGASTNLQRRLRINRQDLQTWYVPIGTVLGVAPGGGLHFYAGPALVRSDLAALRSVADLAEAFYAKPRRAVRITRVGLHDEYPIGTMVEHVLIDGQGTNVGAVVTERKWDFDGTRSSVQTGFLELDVAKMGGR